MKCISVVMIVLISFRSMVVNAGSEATYKQHISDLTTFCGIPQPRVIELAELAKGDEGLKNLLKKKGMRDTIKPQFTILYRCESVGYCDENKYSPKSCELSKKNKKILTFKYDEWVDNKTSYNRYLEVQVEDHKECICKDIER